MKHMKYLKHLTYIFGAAAICTLASLASAQQLPQRFPTFKIGDAVDYYSFGKWLPCTVTSALDNGVYNVKCGATLELRATADPAAMRAHVAPMAGIPQLSDNKDVDFRASSEGRTLGARYGTREPRTCEERKAALSTQLAKDLFICDSEHEFGGQLYLVSDVNLSLSSPRPYDRRQDAAKLGIDPAQPVYDIRASYSNYQCRPIPIDHDNPLDRNCDQYKLSDAAGGCYKNTTGEWHCLMYDFHMGAPATATNVRPPTTVE
jgi:hypothetical protein